MAVTHADLSPPRSQGDVGSKLGVVMMVFSILCGLCCFILCLVGEAMRSEAVWVEMEDKKSGGGGGAQCVYSGSGKTPLTCALGAFISLAVAMVTKHAYILVTVSKHNPPALLASTPNSSFSKPILWLACFFFSTTWICFGVGEVLLMIGIGVETGHLNNWTRPRPNCLVVRQGLFASAGVFGLTTVFLAAGLYLTALHAQQLNDDQNNLRREILDVSFLYASPPRSPRYRPPPVYLEVPHLRQEDRSGTAQVNPSLEKSRIVCRVEI